MAANCGSPDRRRTATASSSRIPDRVSELRTGRRGERRAAGRCLKTCAGVRPPGPRNLITDVAGLRVGNAERSGRLSPARQCSLPAKPCVAAVDVRGGAPGTRETAPLDPANMVEQVHALVLSGGSVFGLDAASAVTER